MRSRASRRRLSDNDIRAASLIVDGFRRVRRSTFTESAIMERVEYHRHSRARMAETAKNASRHLAPDAPETIDDQRRCTRHDHWTCCRGSRGSASLPCHTLRKRVEMGHAGACPYQRLFLERFLDRTWV